MAFEDHPLHGMHDQGLRPRLLHAVMTNHLPDDKQVTRAPAQLSLAVASIRRHHLLWETSPQAVSGLIFMQGAKVLDASKGAVDAWMDKLLTLLSSTVAENRWAGACLLGVTCQECTRQRFLECYSLWFTKLLLPLRQPTDPIFVRAAACASVTDLLVRLGGLIEFAGVRRDAANLISKLVQPLLQILGDKDSTVIWNEAMDLLSTLLRYFPACLRQQSNSVEALLVARIMDVEGNTSLSQKCARALALLPKAHGDATTWSTLLRRILIAINSELDYAFTGMEDAAIAEDAIAALLPCGQDPPWPLGGRAVPANACMQLGKGLWQQLVTRVSFLLQCCNYLLTSPFPVPVPAPLGPLLILSMRILRVDGSKVPSASRLGAPVSTSHQAALCSDLPALHLSALNLLASTLRGVRSQLLPRGADLIRLITDYFRRCGGVQPSLRIKLYNVARHLFMAMGAGTASGLAPAVVGNALSDLKGSNSGANILSPKCVRGPHTSNPVWASGGWSGTQVNNQKKRKEPGGLPGEHPVNGVVDAVSNTTGEGTAPVAVQIAALQSLEALLTSGGALLPDRWRAEVDAVLASMAMGAAAGTISASLTFEEESSFMEGTSASSLSTDFQVAAYQALLASLLSPCCHRPPYLAQGLAVFRNGRQEAGTEVAIVCAHALLALEPLIHPRCLPPAGTPAAVAASMGASRATTSSGNLQVPHMQRPQKPISTLSSASLPGTVASNTSSAANANANGFNGVNNNPVLSSLKIGQLAMDPWAEVDTWLGYGEDFGGDDSLFYPESDGLLAQEFSNGGLGCVGGGESNFTETLLSGNNSEGQVTANGDKMVVGVMMDFRKQTLLVNQKESTTLKMQQPTNSDVDGGNSVEKDVILDRPFREEGAGVVQTDTTSRLVECCSSQGEILHELQPVMIAGQNVREAHPFSSMSIVGISSSGKPAVELGSVAEINDPNDAELCSKMDTSKDMPIITNFVVTDTSYHQCAEDSFTFPNAPVDITSDSDSGGSIPDIIDDDPELESG